MRWTLKPKPSSETVVRLAEELQVSPTIAYLLVQRGVETFEEARDFFRPDLGKLYDPFLMKDMQKAVQRIEEALHQKEPILIYGDYDVDGTTSVALMASYLEQFHSNIALYIPDRYKEGYGISFEGIDFAADNGFSLIIALDCGIKAIEQVNYAAKKGIDFIICDHHRPGEELPKARAVLDPKRLDCDYPFKELCGCGVGFKLIQAFHQKQGRAFKELIPFLDLVATAIAADIVPITGENRILSYHGLRVINEAPREGIKALKQIARKDELTNTDLVFILAPRINAAGRMGDALEATRLLMEKDPEKTLTLAQQVDAYNSERKLADEQITKEALQQIEANGEEDRFTTVVYNENWHKGVIGIVASRLTESYYRPTLVFTRSGDKLAASARSVKGFDIYDALAACSDYIEQFGGHKYAAGLTMAPEQYEGFKQKFEEVVAHTIDKKLLQPEIRIDKPLALNEIDAKFFRILKQFAPFGPGNPEPVFLTERLLDTGYGGLVGKEKKHLKCALYQQGSKYSFGAIGFNLAEKIELLKADDFVEAVYCLDENQWNNRVFLQLKLKDLR